MIIGISGKINSGKDTVGKLILFVIHEMKRELPFGLFYPKCVATEKLLQSYLSTFPEIFEKYDETLPQELVAGYKMLKFKQPIVQVAQILTGMPIIMFEDVSVKNMPISYEYGVWHGDSDKQMSPRQLLQKIGHDAIVEKVDKLAWINSFDVLINNIQPEFAVDNNPRVIITDVRTQEHVDYIKAKRGIIIRVNSDFEAPTELANHPVEKLLDDYKFDFYLENDYISSDFPLCCLLEQIHELFTTFDKI